MANADSLTGYSLPDLFNDARHLAYRTTGTWADADCSTFGGGMWTLRDHRGALLAEVTGGLCVSHS